MLFNNSFRESGLIDDIHNLLAQLFALYIFSRLHLNSCNDQCHSLAVLVRCVSTNRRTTEFFGKGNQRVHQEDYSFDSKYSITNRYHIGSIHCCKEIIVEIIEQGMFEFNELQ